LAALRAEIDIGGVLFFKIPPGNLKSKKEGKMKRFKLGVVVIMALVLTAGFALAGTLDDVRARGYLIAGVNGGVFGFSMPDDKGVWKGLDVDTARAIAAAIYGAHCGTAFAGASG
jgi:hypothetical protein